MQFYKSTFTISDNFYKGLYNNKYTKGKKVFGILWYSKRFNKFFCRANLLNNSFSQDVSVIVPQHILLKRLQNEHIQSKN